MENAPANDSIVNAIRTDLSSATTGTNDTWTFLNIGWVTWIVIILILAFLGFNVFIYLAYGAQTLTQYFIKILQFFGMEVVSTAHNVANTVSGSVDIAASNLNSANNANMNINMNPTNPVNSNYSTNYAVNDSNNDNASYNNMIMNMVQPNVQMPNQHMPPSTNQPADISATILPTNNKRNSLDAALDSAIGETRLMGNTYEADDSYSTVQMSKSQNKAGWCFIGEDRGFRSCTEVGTNDVCMSGDIFPSQDICVNPNLRQ